MKANQDVLSGQTLILIPYSCLITPSLVYKSIPNSLHLNAHQGLTLFLMCVQLGYFDLQDWLVYLSTLPVRFDTMPVMGSPELIQNLSFLAQGKKKAFSFFSSILYLCVSIIEY